MRDNMKELDQIDPDIVLMTAYLDNRLSPAEAAAVDTRLADDEAFFDKVWPLLDAIDLPLAGVTPSDREEGEEEKANVIPIGKAKSRSLASLGINSPLSSRGIKWVGLAMAASVVGVMVMQSRRTPAVSGGGVTVAQGSRGDSILNVLKENGTLASLPEPTVIATGDNETRVVTIASGVKVTLAPRSWIAFSGPAGSIATDAPAAAMGGVVEVDVPVRSRAFRVLTGAGVATLKAGQWALKGLGKTQGFVRMPSSTVLPKR